MSGKKNRKFDRNRKRSKSMARYNGEQRDLTNQKKKISKHLHKHPKDKTVHGSVPDYKVKHHHAKPTKPDMMWDVDGYFKKGEGIKVPHTMYAVVAVPGVLVEFTHLKTTAEEAYRKLKSTSWLIEITNNKPRLIEGKRGTPYLSNKERMSYGKPTKKGK